MKTHKKKKHTLLSHSPLATDSTEPNEMWDYSKKVKKKTKKRVITMIKEKMMMMGNKEIEC
jgi:hypothetical protein